MDDGREPSVQTDMFLILTYDFFEHYLLTIHQSILDIISKILQSFSEESINLKDRERKKFLYPYPKKKNDISSESRYRFNV